MNESYTLSLGFGTDLGKKYTMTVNNADPMVDLATIKDAMAEIIASGVIGHVSGEPNAPLTAKLTKTIAEEINVK